MSGGLGKGSVPSGDKIIRVFVTQHSRTIEKTPSDSVPRRKLKLQMGISITEATKNATFKLGHLKHGRSEIKFPKSVHHSFSQGPHSAVDTWTYYDMQSKQEPNL